MKRVAEDEPKLSDQSSVSRRSYNTADGGRIRVALMVVLDYTFPSASNATHP